MNYILIPLVAGMLASSTYFTVASVDIPSSSEKTVPSIRLDRDTVDAILNTGLEQVQFAIELRDRLEKTGFDYEKAAHIPELAPQLTRLKAYYREAVKERKELSENLEKVITQIQSVFEQKSMSLRKWKIFHVQLNGLFSKGYPLSFGLSKWGNLDFDKMTFAPFSQEFSRRKGFVWFAYIHDGVLGLRALNLAFIEGITILPTPTNSTLLADGVDYQPVDFTDHDAGHSFQFNDSAYSYPRFFEPLKKLYRNIEAQEDWVERVKDHIVLFMFIHEFVAFRDVYYERISELLQGSFERMNEGLSFRFGISKDPIKNAIFDAVRYALNSDPLEINKIDATHYEIIQKPKDGAVKKYHAALLMKNTHITIETDVMFGTEKVTINTATIQYADFDPVLKLLMPKEKYHPLCVATALREFGHSFMHKYTRLKS